MILHKKIVYCIPSLHIHGGVERVISKKASYMADVLGHEVYVIMTDAKDKKPFFPLSPKVKQIQLDENFEELWNKPLCKKIYLYEKHLHNYKRKLTQCLMEIKPDITISTLRREINFLCDIKDGSKKIGEMHVNREEFRNLNQDKGANFIKKAIQFIWTKQLLSSLRKLDYFVVLTEKDKTKWTELDSEKVVAIPNPLYFYADMPEPCQEKRVVAVGRFCYQKGFDMLIDCWKIIVERHPDWRLNIYGDDGEKIRNYIESRNLSDYISIHGVTSNIQQALSGNSIFVLSSRFEGFGMVITEAMACGIPAVSFDCHFGPSDIIQDGIDGLLVEAGNIIDLAEKICDLIEHEDKRKQMGQKAYQNIKRFHIDQIGQKWDNLFDLVLK